VQVKGAGWPTARDILSEVASIWVAWALAGDPAATTASLSGITSGSGSGVSGTDLEAPSASLSDPAAPGSLSDPAAFSASLLDSVSGSGVSGIDLATRSWAWRRFPRR
jgi:hypothetical protein